LPLAAYEEEILGYNFIEYGELGRPRFLVLGLPDAGLVGPIASGHLVLRCPGQDAWDAGRGRR